MDIRSRYAAMSALQEQGYDPKVWREFYAEDIVRRISGVNPQNGREACDRQVQEFLDGLLEPQKFDQIALAFDDENSVSISEYDQSFRHETYGDVSQRLVIVQRWRDDQIFDETIYVMPRVPEPAT